MNSRTKSAWHIQKRLVNCYSFKVKGTALRKNNSSLLWDLRPLRGDKTQSLWPRQELPDPHHPPTPLLVMPPPPREPSPTPSCPLLRKVWGSFLTRPLQGLYKLPTNQQVYHKTPLSPTNQQVSRYILRPLLSPWAIKTDTTMRWGSALPDYQEDVLLCYQHLLFQ